MTNPKDIPPGNKEQLYSTETLERIPGTAEIGTIAQLVHSKAESVEREKSAFSFVILDPRPIPAAQAANDAIFANGTVLGVEVTVPAIAARCQLGNIDPQHSGGDASRAAIEDAMEYALPTEGAVVATTRADMDSVGAMAILNLRAKKVDLAGTESRIRLIVDQDKFARGGWAGPKPLPNAENPWDDKGMSAGDAQLYAAMSAAVMDFKLPMPDRVSIMEKWLLTGATPDRYLEQVERERQDLVRALESGQIKVETRASGRIAVVETTHRAATMVGYTKAPVVVALNPNFKLGDGGPHRKFTICVFDGNYCDVKSATADLAKLEPGWGGSPTIAGSPQGVNSNLTIDQVAEVVEKHLKQ